MVQGDSTLKASVLTIFLEKTAPAPGAPGAPAEPAAPAAAGVGPGQGSSVRHMDAVGPVTMISKDQVGTGDSATYDKGEDKVYLYGNVTLSQGTNVTQGDRLIYDMATGAGAGILRPDEWRTGVERLHPGQRSAGRSRRNLQRPRNPPRPRTGRRTSANPRPVMRLAAKMRRREAAISRRNDHGAPAAAAI